jgi:predicted ferric reductase
MRGNRALWASLLVLVLAIAAFHLRQNGVQASLMPPCLFHKVTGLHCVGCGMTRATHAALHGRFIEAFLHNPLGFVLMPIALFAIALEIVAWVRGRSGGPRLRLGRRGFWVLVSLILIFWVLRNIPYKPFTILAPGS